MNIRTFLAIDFEAEVRARIHRHAVALYGTQEGIRITKESNLHLTMKFLGETRVSSIEPLTESLREITASFPGFPLRIGGVGQFPRKTVPRKTVPRRTAKQRESRNHPSSRRGQRRGHRRPNSVLWVGAEDESGTLLMLAQALDQRCVRHGFPPESRPFRPHVTVGRGRKPNARDTVPPSGEEESEIAHLFVSSIQLKKSELRPEGARYENLARLDLKTSRDSAPAARSKPAADGVPKNRRSS